MKELLKNRMAVFSSSIFFLSMFTIIFMIMKNSFNTEVFPFQRCRAELKLNTDQENKLARVSIFFFFKTKDTGQLEYSGHVYNQDEKYLIRGRLDFNFKFKKEILELNKITRVLSERDMSAENKTSLPEYLSINKGSITFTTRFVSPSHVLLSRYSEPLFIMTCN